MRGELSAALMANYFRVNSYGNSSQKIFEQSSGRNDLSENPTLRIRLRLTVRVKKTGRHSSLSAPACCLSAYNTAQERSFILCNASVESFVILLLKCQGLVTA